MKGRRRFFFTLIKDLFYRFLGERDRKGAETNKQHRYSTH